MGNATSKNNKRTKSAATAAAAAAPPSAKPVNSTNATTTTTPLLMEQVRAFLKQPNPHDVWQDYEKVQLIAHGSTCEVWTVRRRQRQQQEATLPNVPSPSSSSSSSSLYALKIISKTKMPPAVLQEMRNEVAILRTLDHAHILRVYDWYETNDFSYMVMEYCKGGHLLARAPYSSEAQVATVLRQVLSALAYIHARGICHRDIKPENIVYAHTGEHAPIKLIDFGLSKQNIIMARGKNHQVNMHCQVGTLLSMSPQVIRGNYTNKADIWSVGTVAYTLLSNSRPFDGATQRDIVNAILDRGRYKPMKGPKWNDVSDLAKDFCAKLLQYEPDQRPTAEQALQHEWLKKYKTTQTGNGGGSTTSSKTTAETMSRIQNALLASGAAAATAQDKDKKNAIFEQLVAMMVAYETPSESLQEYHDAFTAMDPANSGRITYWQFRAALNKSKCNLTESVMKNMFASLDLDQNGSINYTEFLALALLARGQFEQEEIAAAFCRMDMDRNGYLSRQDLCAVLGSRFCSSSPGSNTCDDVVDSILQQYDTDKDDQISYQEFLAIFREKHRKGLEDRCCAVLEQGQLETEDTDENATNSSRHGSGKAKASTSCARNNEGTSQASSSCGCGP